jgi:cation:H+ antiporter
VTVWNIAMVVVGLVVLVGGAEVLIRSASRLAVTIGISPLVVGLTVVAFGTSAPELAVGVQAALDGQTDLALGNVTGSNMFNTLAVLGVASVIGALVVRQKLVRREMPVLVLVSLVVLVMALNGGIGRIEGLVLFAGAVGYTVWAILIERNEPPEVQAEYVGELVTAVRPRHWSINVLGVLVGLALLVLGARWLVSGASEIAVSLGMSELLVGVTIVAIGTSLPELATSVVAAVRGERDIAVGNVVGSNLFNLLVVLGLSAVVSPTGVPVPTQVMDFQLPALVVVSLLCFGVFYTQLLVRRWEGVAFLALYAAYMAYTVAEATDSDALNAVQVVSAVMVTVVAVAVAFTTWRALRSGNAPLVDSTPGSS